MRRASLALINTSRYSVAYYFFLTEPSDPAVLRALLAENATHGDLAFSQRADTDTSHKLHDEMAHVALAAGAPRAHFVGKFDDDSMVRYDTLLPILDTVQRTGGVLWARRGGWGFFPWWNFICSANVAAAVAAQPMPLHCQREDDVCVGELSRGSVTFFIDDPRWFNLDPAALCTSAALWCRPSESNPINDTDALVAHHATADVMHAWANASCAGCPAFEAV